MGSFSMARASSLTLPEESSCRRRHSKNSSARSIWIAAFLIRAACRATTWKQFGARWSWEFATMRARTISPGRCSGCPAVTMPSPYSSRGSVDDSFDLARRLGIQIIERPIGEAFHTLRNELGLPEPDLTNKTDAERAVENLQSRLRGNILMTISNAENRLLLSTGNKSELALGYCTLYGDTNGGLAVIGDVLKTEVYALARQYNLEQEIIPRSIIEK